MAAKNDGKKDGDAKAAEKKDGDAEAAEKKGGDAKGDGAEGEKKPPARGTGPTASRQQKRREERLKLIDEQVADGTLTIRQMTPAERKANPPKNRSRKKRS